MVFFATCTRRLRSKPGLCLCASTRNPRESFWPLGLRRSGIAGVGRTW